VPLIDEKLMYFSCLANTNSENVKRRIRGSAVGEPPVMRKTKEKREESAKW